MRGGNAGGKSLIVRHKKNACRRKMRQNTKTTSMLRRISSANGAELRMSVASHSCSHRNFACIGYRSLEFDGLVGILGPRNMPQAARDLIAADIRTIAAEPEVVARLSATGKVVNPGSPSEFAAALAEQRAAVAEMGKVLGIKPAQ